MCSRNNRGLTDDTKLIVVGKFVKPVKKDGTMLFKSCFSDSDFLLDLKLLYHETFGTKWDISSIQRIAKGFHIKLKKVNNIFDADFLSGETFAALESDIKNKPIDFLIGEQIYTKDKKPYGEIISFAKTPSYLLFEVLLNNNTSSFIPFTEEFIEIKKEKITLLKEV
ncbi:MAG: hypothetical protein ACOX2F_04215 [bacterium]